MLALRPAIDQVGKRRNETQGNTVTTPHADHGEAMSGEDEDRTPAPPACAGTTANNSNLLSCPLTGTRSEAGAEFRTWLITY
ncbi:unnamed protein product [Soboliphyme baturini]|uniref:Nanos-type domain-containing protein n=1 Tax=Soboliphyme baturini TaxID=241478 RepID=A0A183IEI5_9BILA|nr:unnamed protein product [Soboliphyme baturini]